MATEKKILVCAKLEEMGVSLPPPSVPKGSYCNAVKTGNLLFLSGHLPIVPGEGLMTGQVDDVAVGKKAAKWCVLNLLASVQQELGNLERVTRIVKLSGFINAKYPKDLSVIMNGASDFVLEAFGKKKGLHSRAAIGVAHLPLDAPVEVEAVIEFE